MSAPTVVGTPTSGSQASGTTVATSFSTGWAANDVAFIFLWQAGTTVPTTPTGWSLVASQTAGNPRCWVYRRVLQAGDTAPTITVSNVVHNWGVVILHGADTTTPEDGTNNNFNATTAATVVALGVTTSVATDFLLTSFGNNSSQSGTPPSGTELLDITTNGTAAFQLNGETLSAAGATGTRTETLAGNGGNEGSITIAVRGTANTTFTKSLSGAISSAGAATKQANKFGGNVLANPGAEDGTSGWSGGGWGIVNLDVTHPHSGSTAFLLQSGVPSGAGDMALVSGYIPVVAGQLVHGEAWVRATGTGRVAYIEYQFWNAAQNAIVATLDGPQITDSATYQQLTYEAVTPAGVGAAYVQMWVWFQSCPQNETHDIDDLVLKLPASIGPAGVLTRSPAKRLAGTVASSGVLVRRVGKVVAGSISSAGAYNRLPKKALRGVMQLPYYINQFNLAADTKDWIQDNTGAFWGAGAGALDAIPASADSVLLLDHPQMTDGYWEVTVFVSSITGTPANVAVGLEIRSAGTVGTGYALICQSDGTVRFTTPYGGLVGPVMGPYTAPTSSGAAITLGLQAAGNVLTAYVNGVQAGTYTDTGNHYPGPGYVGVFLGGESGGSYTGVYVRFVAAPHKPVARERLVLQPEKPLSGSITSGGVLRRALSRLLQGTVSPSGTVSRSIARNVSGQIASSGILTRSLSRQLAGSVSSNGTFAYSLTRVLAAAGSVSSTGDLVRLAQKNLVGSASASATLVRQQDKVTAGAIASSGFVARYLVRVASGSVTPDGTLTKSTSKQAAGAITSDGALVRSAGKLLNGAVSSSGAMTAVRGGLALAGSISSAGSVSRHIAKSVAGEVSLSGALSFIGVVQIQLQGSISSTGGLVLQSGRSFAGAVPAVGTLVRTAGRTFAGELSTSGQEQLLGKRLLAGAITPVGDLSQRVALSLAGTVHSGGRVSRALLRALSGQSSPSGALRNRVGTALAGQVDPGGLLALTRIKRFAGGLQTAGSLSRDVIRHFSGAVTPAGSLRRVVAASFEGSVVSQSALKATRLFVISLVGSVSPVGDLVRRVGKRTVGATGLSGVVRKRAERSFFGEITPVGALRKRLFVSMAGAIVAAGDVLLDLVLGRLEPVTITVGVLEVSQEMGVLDPVYAVGQIDVEETLGVLAASLEVADLEEAFDMESHEVTWVTRP